MASVKQPELKSIMKPEEVTPEVVKKGLIVALHPREVFWKLDSNKVELNAFTGVISSKVDGKELSPVDVMGIVNGVRTGRLIVIEKLVVGTPVNTKWSLSEFAPGARKLLDYSDVEFKEAVSGNYSRKLLQAAVELEKEGKNRGDRIKILSNKLVDLARSV